MLLAFSIPQWWGLNLNQSLFVLAAILLVIDIFFLSDIPTHIAYLVLTAVTFNVIDAPLLLRLLYVLLVWFGLVAFHYLIYRKLLEKIANRWIAPNRHTSGPEHLIGKIGKIKTVDGQPMLAIEGDLLPCELKSELPTGTQVKVVRCENGVPVIEAI